MNKKIKIIELLNKIANGEEMPKEIKFDNEVFVYIDKWEQYVTKKEEIPLLRRICDYNYSGLNDEVEILEDNTEEIEELDTLNAYKLMESPYMAQLLKEQRYDEFMEHLKQSEVEIANTIMKAEDKINELVKAVNEIRKEKNNV